MSKLVRDLVDFEGLLKRIWAVDCSESSKELAKNIMIPENPKISIEDALRRVDYTEYVKGVSNELMVKELYERLVSVHQLERGMVGPIYVVNRQFRNDNTFYKCLDGITSSDNVTYQSCAGHLSGEPQIGRDMGFTKTPFVAFLREEDIIPRNKGQYTGLIESLKRGKGLNFNEGESCLPKAYRQIGSVDEDIIISEIRDFWKSFLGRLNEDYGEQTFDLGLADVIRPPARVPKV